MRSYGEINDVLFSRQGFDVYNLAYKYSLSYYNHVKTVFVNNMKELKQEISTFKVESEQGLHNA